MKCAEVMEWMHRYLDHDLSRDEIDQMFRHIDQCPSCAEVFERLSLLSKKLEQLPDVKPPFSLVDSILPQLAELDRGSREQSAVKTEEPVVVPFSNEGSRPKASKRASVASRTGIGAVAAAIILGIAIFNMPDKMPGAEVEHLLQNASTTAGNESANNMDMRSQTANTSDTNEAMPADRGSNQDASQESAADLPAPANLGREGSTGDAAPDQAGDPTAMPQPTSAQSGAVPGERMITEPSASAEPNPTEKTVTPKRDSGKKAEPSASSGASNSPLKNDKKEPATDIFKDKDRPGDSVLSPKIPYDMTREVMSFSNIDGSNLQTWTSPDEQYVAEFMDEQLNIIKNNPKSTAEDRLVVISFPLEGSWISGEWSSDSTKFTYVIEKDGVNITKVYTVGDEAVATSAPGATPMSTPVSTPKSTPTSIPTSTPQSTPSPTSTN